MRYRTDVGRDETDLLGALPSETALASDLGLAGMASPFFNRLHGTRHLRPYFDGERSVRCQ